MRWPFGAAKVVLEARRPQGRLAGRDSFSELPHKVKKEPEIMESGKHRTGQLPLAHEMMQECSARLPTTGTPTSFLDWPWIAAKSGVFDSHRTSTSEENAVASVTCR